MVKWENLRFFDRFCIKIHYVRRTALSSQIVKLFRYFLGNKINWEIPIQSNINWDFPINFVATEIA